MSILESVPSLEVLSHSYRRWRNNRLIGDLKHCDVMASVCEEGTMTSRYAFMVTTSCAIAILGLLLSSPAVIIGAMLISPLMGPIMSLGFSLCVVDIREMRQALFAIGAGFVLAVVIAYIIVRVSPITDITLEILARTKPNLFDLLVAFFSGLAGGYATIKQKGAAIVGVAIATALMPPLAVVGYGLAVENWQVTQGAFFLFMTNLLAIALTVTLLARWYGFGSHNSQKHTLWQAILIFSVFGLLSLPLGVALKNIAYQSYITQTTKVIIDEYFAKSNTRSSDFSIDFLDDKISIDSVMITDKYDMHATSSIEQQLKTSFGGQVTFNLNQIIAAKGDQERISSAELATNNLSVNNSLAANSLTANSLAAKTLTADTRVNEQAVTSKAIEAAVFFPLQFLKVDSESRRVFLYPQAEHSPAISVLYDVENNLQQQFPEWTFELIPPAQALPIIYFAPAKSEVSSVERKKIEHSVWALRRWNLENVLAVGFASTSGAESYNRRLAKQRAVHVKSILDEYQINAQVKTEFISDDQSTLEYRYGVYNFQRVEIRIDSALAATQVSRLDESSSNIEKSATQNTTQ